MANNDEKILNLENQINEYKDKINTIYLQIGELYYTRKDEANSEISTLCQTLDQINEQIEILKKEILKIKQIVICPTCGNENPETATFCLKCGTKLINTINDGKHCVNCGAPIMEGQQFCTRCGTKVETIEELPEEKDEDVIIAPVEEAADLPETAASVDAEIKSDSQQEEVEQEQKNVCPNCGKEIVPGQLFCTGCGASLKNTEQPVVEEKTKLCPYCHSPIKEGQKFCVSCGQKLDTAPANVKKTVKVCPNCGLEIDGLKDKCDICGTPLNQSVNQGNVCPKCGRPVKPGQLFCTGCGTKLS